METPASFDRTVHVFVRYLGIVEPLSMAFGFLNARVGFGIDDQGVIRYWMQDLMTFSDDDNDQLFKAVERRVKHFVRDLNRSHLFADVNIKHTYDIYSSCDQYGLHRVHMVDWDDWDD